MTSYTPGSGDDKDLISAFEAALGTQPNVGQKSSFRRLFHEAYAVILPVKCACWWKGPMKVCLAN